MEKKQIKQVVNGMAKNAYTWKQVVKQLSGLTAVTLKDGTKVTPAEAWALLGVKSEKSSVKAKNVRAAWSGKLRFGEKLLVRTKDSVRIELNGQSYPLFTDDYKSVKVWGWHGMANASDVNKEEGDVKVTAQRVLDGLFDCKFADDALKETDESLDAAEKVVSGYIDMGDRINHQWVAVRKIGDEWMTKEDAEQAEAIDINVKVG